MIQEAPFGDLPGVQLTSEHGLAAVRVGTESASGLVYLQGAHVAAWQPAGQAPVIWMSERAVYAPGKALRGGIPICFPWFDAHAEHEQYPAHGFARTLGFTYRGARLDAQGRTELEFTLESSPETEAFFPFASSVRYRVAFGSSLGLEFQVVNRGSQAFTFEEALHSYFAVSDVTQVSVLGLQGASYTDKVRDRAVFTEEASALRITGETDRVYESSATCQILDPGLARAIRIEKSQSASSVVWNPWAERAAEMADLGANAWPGMLCVESANVGTSKITLPGGAAHILRVTVSVTPSAAGSAA
ncbi:MAG: D-hexose-6-phosphate mutarotase [Polyangiaceae bacterium]